MSFWDIRLSIACAATDAEYQNRTILHDNTLNLPVVAEQPHPDPEDKRNHSVVQRLLNEAENHNIFTLVNDSFPAAEPRRPTSSSCRNSLP